MIKDRHLLTASAAVSLCVLGTVVLTGWAIGSSMLVRLVPGSVAMSINTAFMFAVAGASLLLHARGHGEGRWAKVSAALLILLSTLILIEHLFDIDLPIDLAHVHDKLGDGHAKPGRTAPNACLAFLLAGVVLVFPARARARGAARLLIHLMTALILVIGVTAFVGYLMRLDAMYQIASFNRMATMTALGVSVLGAGVWSLFAGAVGRAEHVKDEAQRITKLAAGLLIVFAIATGLLSFSVLRESYERAAADYHENTAGAIALDVGHHIAQANLLSATLARRPSITEPLADLIADHGSVKAHAELEKRAGVFRQMGFSTVSIVFEDGSVAYQDGQLRTPSAQLEVRFDGTSDSNSLRWDQGFYIRSVHRITDQGQVIGSVITERALPLLDAIIAQAYRASISTDVLLCSRVGDASRCFPSRFYHIAPGWPLLSHGKATLPISRALLGETGAASVKDPRGVAVVAGFAPLREYGMGVVVKTDVRELYMPLRAQMHVLLGGMVLFVVLGVLLLRRWLQPLIAQIVEERRRIKAILENANDAFIGIGPDGMVSDWNKQAELTLGVAPADAIGKDLARLIIPEPMRAGHNRGMALFRSSGKGPVINTRIEVGALHAAGHEVPVELSVTAFQVGSGYGASAFVRDLTERKRAEQQAAEHALAMEEARVALAQSQKLEAVGKLTGGIAHDFNNVLQVIGGSLELLIHEGISDQRVLRRVDTAMGAVDRASKLASHLLAFARKQPLQPRPTNLARVVHDMADMLQRAIGDAIDIQMVSGAGLWNTLVDAHQLEQVVLNLAINARDAMDGSGQLTIEIANADLDPDYTAQVPGLAPGQFVMLAISDTGCGMEQATIERAFEPFFSTKPEGQGTGLGLSMTYGFVKQSNGHIMIYSEPGHGTTIRIYLPRSHAAEEVLAPSAMQQIEGGHEAILVVEDDLAVQATAVEQLERLGYQVQAANSADAAKEIIDGGARFDLLFTDVVMPGKLRSPELARRSLARLPQLKVLFTSGYTQNAIVHGGRLDPGVHLLSKPYSREQLATKVRALLSEPGLAVVNSALRVAFVEDNEDFRMLGYELIAMLGHEVSAFGDAEAALAQLTAGSFDVLLTDVGLPGMSGLLLAERVHQIDPQLRIVIASGYGDTLAGTLGFAHRVLTKPFTIEQLEQCLTV